MQKNNGFTLIELLVVLVILATLAALVGPELFGNVDRAQRTTAATQISNLEASLDNYRLDVGRYPDTLQGLVENTAGSPRWNGPYLRDDVPMDPWDNPYQYDSTGRNFTLVSYGADGLPGGEDNDSDIGL